jgi:predicted neuraminidase
VLSTGPPGAIGFGWVTLLLRRRGLDRCPDETADAKRGQNQGMSRRPTLFAVTMVLLVASAMGGRAASGTPFHRATLLFPLEHWHNHASMIVELPEGDLLVCWFHGSGERTADDVVVRGARLRTGAGTWSAPFLMADTPGFPDTNPTMFLDAQRRLWLLWPAILANEWPTALMQFKRSSDYAGDGAPRWTDAGLLLVKPGEPFRAKVEEVLARLERDAPGGSLDERAALHVARLRKQAAAKLTRRLGWMTRAHPQVLDGSRLIVPLYSDGYSFSLMAISDDGGETWRASEPLVGLGNIQPTLARRRDGTLVAYMRDNGPAPKRLHVSESRDRGETWSPVRDSELPNPGSGAEVLVLQNGHWALVYNDLARGRYSLAVSISEDEGRTWPYTRHLERDPVSASEEDWGQYHYPSLIQARDGTLHATYSYFVAPSRAEKDEQGRAIRKSIKHAHFNEAWVRAGGMTE